MNFLRKWGLALLLLLATGFVVAYGIHRRKQWKKDHVYIELKAFQTSKGWGYDVLSDGRPYIHQDVVPVIAAHGWGFRTKDDALAVGQRVYERVLTGKAPIVTPDDINTLGIIPADSLHR